MKKVKFSKKLSLSKEVVVNLSNGRMNGIYGGNRLGNTQAPTCQKACNTVQGVCTASANCGGGSAACTVTCNSIICETDVCSVGCGTEIC